MPPPSMSPFCTEDVPAPPGAASMHGRGASGAPGSGTWDTPLERMAAPDPHAASDERTLFDAVVARAGFDPAGFNFAVHPIRESADLGAHMELMVTVTCRAARVSRTYLSRARDAGWLSDLSNDLRAGVYGT